MNENKLDNIVIDIKSDGFNCFADNEHNRIVFIKEDYNKVKTYLDNKYGKDTKVTNIMPDGKAKLVKTIPFSYAMVG